MKKSHIRFSKTNSLNFSRISADLNFWPIFIIVKKVVISIKMSILVLFFYEFQNILFFEFIFL
ncbi:hypothetical protein LEP1GSC073_3249 [Leptospira noguchii str. Cascata]|nr:hypothetical protein LEP1GSC073_3249 [Leptospira noguchii str. Cascata]